MDFNVVHTVMDTVQACPHWENGKSQNNQFTQPVVCKSDDVIRADKAERQ